MKGNEIHSKELDLIETESEYSSRAKHKNQANTE